MPIADVLRDLAREGTLGAGLEGAKALAAWEAVAGPLGSLCRVEGFRAGEMLLAARSPAAAQEVSLRREAIRRKINTRLGREVVRSIRVAHRADGWETGEGVGRAAEGARASEPPVAAGEAEQIDQQVARIGDASTREAARRVLMRVARLRAARLAMGWRPCPRCGTLTDPHRREVCPFCRPASDAPPLR
ncbi:MAG: DUF721 domain-containing protein [Armatimonadota bacterium]|nr:DUF721 domain-containing protein [Armatimonadota bacterium]MDR5696737.1 DUF721 domain-containing protein [Armatimonadota bacterium]